MDLIITVRFDSGASIVLQTTCVDLADASSEVAKVLLREQVILYSELSIVVRPGVVPIADKVAA